MSKARRIISVGFSYPDTDADEVEFISERSILDADIIIFEPQLSDIVSHTAEQYQGKPLLSESASFRVREAAAHWRSELRAALNDGKTIIVFLARPEQVFIDTGKRQTSGTGRNQQVTRIVEEFTPYSALPSKLGKLIPRGGDQIRVASNIGVVASYWREFGNISPYQVYLEEDSFKPILTTRTGNKTVGTVIQGDRGAMVLLPPPEFDWDKLYERDEDGDYNLTDEANRLGKRFTAALIELDRDLRADSVGTPVPDWADDPQYELPGEAKIRAQVELITSKILDLEAHRTELYSQLAQEGSPRGLLIERGKRLEAAVVNALQQMGFNAAPVVEGDSEFDVIFESEEGRFLGEVEGKESKPINIDKLSQLERNIQEDFAREGVTEYAKGVLFGNAYLQQPPQERTEAYFTPKCISGAQRSGIALVRTPDLFNVEKEIRDGASEDFKKACREAIANTAGTVVAFPTLSRRARRKLM